MEQARMNSLIEAHIASEKAADPAGAVANYTDDVEHDVVGSPSGPAHGKIAAQKFYEYLIQNFLTEEMMPVHRYYGEDFCVMEHRCTGTVPGTFFGVPGDGSRITFRLLHVWEFRDGKIRRENVWLDSGSIFAQLTPGSGAQ
jgi:steroid delta-isomerase-like uncharacterized protein